LQNGGKTVAVLAIDPTSPFNLVRCWATGSAWQSHFNNPDVFIRSLATRGSLGGLSAKTIEMTDVLRAAGFDYILIETVGVGQSEIEIAGLADITLVVLVPEAAMKSKTLNRALWKLPMLLLLTKLIEPMPMYYANNAEKDDPSKRECAACI
jgi:LAO/AO transport system kinase